MRKIAVFGTIAAIQIWAAPFAGAQSAGSFDLICNDQVYDQNGRDFLFNVQTRYSIDLDRGVGCLQTASNATNNFCSARKPISRNGNVITFEATGYPVTIDLGTGKLNMKTLITVSRGTCTRAAFTPPNKP